MSGDRVTAWPLPKAPRPRHILESPKRLSPRTTAAILAGYRQWLDDPEHPLLLCEGVRFRTLNPDGSISPEVNLIVEPNPPRLWPVLASGIGGMVIGFVAASGLT